MRNKKLFSVVMIIGFLLMAMNAVAQNTPNTSFEEKNLTTSVKEQGQQDMDPIFAKGMISKEVIPEFPSISKAGEMQFPEAQFALFCNFSTRTDVPRKDEKLYKYPAVMPDSQ